MNVSARRYAVGLAAVLALALITNCGSSDDEPTATPGVDAGPGRRNDGGAAGSNACGGSQTLSEQPGEPCGPCGVDKLVCNGQNAVTCGGQTTSCWVQAAAGSTHTCGIRGDGSLWCWGEAANGKLGNGSSTGNQSSPVRVQASGGNGETPWTDWIAIAAGGTHTCGLRSNGTAWCWGDGANGRRGDAATTATRNTPVQVLAAGETAGGTTWSDWKTIAAGPDHTCGVRSTGSAWCWGSGASGQLGDGNTAATRSTPAQVLAVVGTETPWTDWSALTMGSAHTCGHRTTGSLWCWGSGTDGLRGDGVDNAGAAGRRTRPVQVLASGQVEGGNAWSDWDQIASGDAHSCGLRSDGTAWCWGVGQYGRLGDGKGAAADVALVPVQVLAGGASEGGATWNDWVSVVASSGTFSCGIREGGSLWCWGGGGNGKLGNGNVGPDQLSPVRVLAEGASEGGQAWSDWKSVVAGVAHACGIRTDGSLWCWGRGSSGERGDGTTEASRGTPVKVREPQ